MKPFSILYALLCDPYEHILIIMYKDVYPFFTTKKASQLVIYKVCLSFIVL